MMLTEMTENSLQLRQGGTFRKPQKQKETRKEIFMKNRINNVMHKEVQLGKFKILQLPLILATIFQ